MKDRPVELAGDAVGQKCGKIEPAPGPPSPVRRNVGDGVDVWLPVTHVVGGFFGPKRHERSGRALVRVEFRLADEVSQWTTVGEDRADTSVVNATRIEFEGIHQMGGENVSLAKA